MIHSQKYVVIITKCFAPDVIHSQTYVVIINKCFAPM